MDNNEKTQNNKEAQKLAFHKVGTNIPGFDSLLYDGLDISAPCTVIFVKGEEDAERALWSAQMIYGLAQSIQKIIPQNDYDKYYPHFVSTVQDSKYINDVLLDIIISSSITTLRNKKLSSNIELSNTFADEFFELDDVLCHDFEPSLYNYLPLDIMDNIDKYICMEAAYYSNRTNSLHLRTKNAKSDTMNVLFKRKNRSILKYFSFDDDSLENIEPSSLDKMNLIGEYVGYTYIPTLISRKPEIDDICHEINNANLIAVDIPNLNESMAERLIYTINTIRQSANENQDEYEDVSKSDNHRVIIITLPLSESKIPDYIADMIITLAPTVIQDYRIDRLSIVKSRFQTSALGWHQYKFRDYGFEVYRSLHRIFQVRRYLQRAMVYTHSNVISDTYQQYLFQVDAENCNKALEDYNKAKDKITDAYLEALYPEQRLDYRTSELMSRILLCNPDKKPLYNDTEALIQNHIHKTQEGVTAIIGDGNTFKRFLTFGGIFSSSLNQEHTLILMLNKDERMIRRRLGCPARINRDKDNTCCKNCYSYIHFMNIMMGCITPEEFLYYLQLQLDIAFQDGKNIKRIVIDDLQVLDYCFPLLKGNSLFLSALALLCRERDITLHILCDKNCESVNALRAIVDNIICTDRDDSGKLLVYVERFAGYHNSPSKIYCGKISSVSKLFECYDRRNTYFHINNGAVDELIISTMNKFWSNNCEKKKQK